MKKKLRLLSLALCTTMVLGLTACGGGNSTGGAGSGGSVTTTAPGGENVFVFAGPNNITQWDPLNENKTNAYMLGRLTYNTLVNPYGENNAIQPELATGWSVSEDGLEWTFKLREGVKFHNGEDFNADSVAATLNRILDNPTLVHAGFWPSLAGAEAKDTYTAVIQLIPKLTGPRDRLASIPGTAANAENLPKGCPFNERCTKCTDICRYEPPKMVMVRENHYVACHRIGEGE